MSNLLKSLYSLFSSEEYKNKAKSNFNFFLIKIMWVRFGFFFSQFLESL